MTQTPTSTHENIREHYAKAAASASCCGTAQQAQGDASNCCASQSSFYSQDMLTEMPTDISSFSLGCGDPITLANLQSGEIVLDLGSGAGLDCFLAAREVGETGRVIGVDMTPEMLARARSSAKRMNITNVEFREGYIENLPVEDNSVDVVISNCVINLSPDKPQVFRDMLRALKPGGRIAVSDIVINGEIPEELKNDPDAWGACVSGALDIQEYVLGLIEAGFTDVKVQPRENTEKLLNAMPLNKLFSAVIMAKKPE